MVAIARNVARMALGRGASLSLPSGYTNSIFDGVPKLGLGLAALGRPGYINLNRGEDLGDGSSRSEEAMQDAAFQVLDAAFACGLRYFDCARSYGLSEKFLAAWLKERALEPGEVVVGTKWGYRYTADWKVEVPGGGPHEVKDHSLDHLIGQACESQSILGDHLNLLQIHSATLESGVLEDDAVIDRLVRLRSHWGWRLGLSLSGPAQGATLDKALELGVFDTVQATFNVMEQSAGPALLKAREAGMDVIVKEAMGNGRVLALPPLVAAAEKLDATPDALALAAVMSQPFQPSVVLSGAVSAQQLESNAKSLGLEWTTDDEEGGELESLMAACRVDANEYWEERSGLQWN